MTDVQKIAFDTLKAGAPGLSDQTRETLAGIIARKVALSTTPVRAEVPSDDLRTACKAVLDDYQTSDAHHPDHVLIRRTDFDRIKALVEAPVVARAEAQDEGAAGYSVALLASYCGDDTSGCTDKTPCLDCVKMANVYKVPKFALGEFVGELGNIAAPSPTPAADANRVRADRYYEALVQADLKIRSLPGTDQSDVAFIRAALKSTAAKEGEK